MKHNKLSVDLTQAISGERIAPIIKRVFGKHPERHIDFTTMRLIEVAIAEGIREGELAKNSK